MRALIRIWDPSIGVEELVQRLVRENVLAKASRARMKDVLRRTFLPRYVNGDPPDAWRFLQPLERAGWPAAYMRLLLYYHASRSERLLYDFVVDTLWERYHSGSFDIGVSSCLPFFRLAEKAGRITPPWSETVSLKVGRGLLTALRDFGLLEGKALKRIQRPSLPTACFAYLAFLIKQEVSSGQRVLEHTDWRLFLLEQSDVERLFLEAHQADYLQYHALGNIVRIDFQETTMEGLVHAILAKAA